MVTTQISAATGTYGAAAPPHARHGLVSMAALGKALDAGDITGAQKMLGAPQTTSPPDTDDGTTTTTSTMSIKADLISLGQALSSGNIPLARMIFDMMRHHKGIEAADWTQPKSNGPLGLADGDTSTMPAPTGPFQVGNAGGGPTGIDIHV